jgi:glycosyltransferase involved in cell wall biosynthesis
MIPYLSVVIPVLNERESLQQLHQELTAALIRIKQPYEIVFVDDGSSDGSVGLCKSLVASDPHVVLVELRRHFGKATALQSGFEIARGEVIVTMDGDLQDDPAELPKFLDRLNDGFDLVSGWKENRRDSFLRRLESKIFNLVTSVFTGLALRDFNCGFKAYRREVTQGLHLYGELYRYIPALAYAKGHRVGEVAVHHRQRLHGVSKYSYERLLRAPFDLLTTLFLIGFQKRPLHLFGGLGVLVGGIGLIINAWLAILWLGGKGIGDRPLLMLGTLMIIVGIQLLSFGLLAEMIASATYRPSEVLGLVREVHRHGGRQDSHAA